MAFYKTYEEDGKIYLEIEDDDQDDSKPECCIACGGPYPDCVDSCKVFDD